MYTVKFRKLFNGSFWAVVRKQDHLAVSVHKSRDVARRVAKEFNVLVKNVETLSQAA